jgi:hypothetical protein
MLLRLEQFFQFDIIHVLILAKELFQQENASSSLVWFLMYFNSIA